MNKITSRDLVKLDEVINKTFEHYACLNKKHPKELLNDAIVEFLEDHYGNDLNKIAMIEYLSKHYNDNKHDGLLNMYMYILDSNFSNERGKMNPTLRLEILHRDGFRCCYCGRKSSDGVVLHVDHIIPIELGGKTKSNNLQTLCDECNIGKSDHLIDVPPTGDSPYYDYFYKKYVDMMAGEEPDRRSFMITQLNEVSKKLHTDKISAFGIIFITGLDAYEKETQSLQGV